LELARGCALVARIAIQRRMGAQKRETILVLLDLPQGHVPTLHRVALLAPGTELPPVDVGVAIGTLGTDVGENRLGMALRAGYALVHAAQRETGFVVIKFRYRASRFPSRGGVAVLAGNVQIAVWTVRTGIQLRLRTLRSSARQHQNPDDQIDKYRGPPNAPALLGFSFEAISRITKRNMKKMKKGEAPRLLSNQAI